jgi:sugar phosphate permease
MDRERALSLRAWTLSWISYATYYVGRKGFSVAKKTLSHGLGLSEGTLGLIDTAYLVAYAGGQFGSGLLGDRLGARRLVGFGLLGSALACAGFGASSAAWLFALLFFANGLFQSSGWPGTTRAMAEWTTTANRGTVMAFWSTCYQVGGVAANALAGYLLVRHGWRSVFLWPAAILAVVGVLVLLALPTRAAEPNGEASENGVRGSLSVERERVRAAQRAVLRDRALWSYGASYFFIKFIRYALLFWLPYYLSTTLSYAADVAANVASAFEIGGVVGVIVIGTLSDRLLFLSRAALSALTLLGLAAALLAYVRLSMLGVTANALGLALIGGLLFGPDALLSGAAAQDAGGVRAAASAAGFVNGVGSIGAAVEGLAVPAISAHFGWKALFPVLMVLALGSSLALIPAIWSSARNARG